MNWFRDLPPLPGAVIAAVMLCGAAVIAFVAIRVLAGGWLLGIGLLAAVAYWEFHWEQPRRERRRRAMIEARQQAPGTQALRSQTGRRHWSDPLPRPLALLVTGAPATLLVVATFVVTAFAMDAFAMP